jgi:hypothetical protein
MRSRRKTEEICFRTARKRANEQARAQLCPSADRQRSKRMFESQPLLAGEGAHARRRPSLHLHRPLHPLCRACLGPMDEVTAALVHQRAIAGDRRDPDQGLPRGDPFGSGIGGCSWNEHPWLYISIHQHQRSSTQIRNVRISTGSQYYIDVFPK